MENTVKKNAPHALPRKDRAPRTALLLALAMLCFSFGIAPGAQAATFVVDRTDDNSAAAAQACTAAANDCSLRGAVIKANVTPNSPVGVADVINVPAGTYTLTIPGSTEDAAATGDLDITDTVTINGGGSANTIIQAGTTNANGIDKVFSVNQVTGNASATFNGVTVRFGRNTNASQSNHLQPCRCRDRFLWGFGHSGCVWLGKADHHQLGDHRQHRR